MSLPRITLNPTVAELVVQGIAWAVSVPEPIDLTCPDCRGSGLEPSGVEYMGHHEMVGCQECQSRGVIDQIEVWADDPGQLRGTVRVEQVPIVANGSQEVRRGSVVAFESGPLVLWPSDDGASASLSDHAAYSDHWEPGCWALILSEPRLLEEVEE